MLAAAVALSGSRPAVALPAVAGPGLAASPSLFTLSYGPALSVLGYLLGRRSAGPGPALRAFAGTAGGGHGPRRRPRLRPRDRMAGSDRHAALQRRLPLAGRYRVRAAINADEAGLVTGD
ncbi:hypothetical protein ABZ951_29280 [Streptomyces sp. NPDC046215]|uniref:hypothetical protein n=1 Tax=Streptomyces sp. NPDC046215 TaxID=3155774 RepID=UPI0033C36531